MWVVGDVDIFAKKFERVFYPSNGYVEDYFPLSKKDFIVIREFRRKLANFLEEGNKQEVYQIGIQLLPLTVGIERVEK